MSESLVRLANGTVEVSFDGGGCVTGLTNLKTGTAYLPDSERNTGRLWSVVVKDGPNFVTIPSSDSTCTSDAGAHGAEFSYRINIGRSSGYVLVRCGIALRGDEITFNASIENRCELSIEEFHYPIIGGVNGLARHEAPRWLYMPIGPGARYANPELTAGGRRVRYPQASMQWMEYANKNEGLYLASYDASLNTTFMEATTSGTSLFFSFTKHPFIGEGERWDSAEYIIALHVGDWHAGAKKYQKWAATWLPSLAKPDWAREWLGWFLVILKQQNGDIMWRYRDIPRLLELARRSGINTVGVFGWGVGGHDHLYPDYSPDPDLGGREELESAIREAQSMGGRIILYTNGQLIDTSGTYFEEVGKRIAARNRDGNHSFQTWRKYSDHPGYLHAVACPYTTEWREKLLELARQVHELGADGVLYDQIGGGSGADFCFSRDHGHARPSEAVGPSIAANFRAIRKQMLAIDPEFVVMTEQLNDALCHSVDMIHATLGGRFTEESFPALFRYTFPEYRITNRYGAFSAPYQRPSECNFIFTYGLSVDIESRYPADAELLKSGTRPSDADYATIPTAPDVTMMRDEPLAEYEEYMHELNSIRAENPVLIRGTFGDTEGFEIDNESVVAVSYVLEDQMAVVIWNQTEAAQRCSVSAPGYELVRELRPGQVDTTTEPIGALSVAVRLYTCTRNHYTG